jgi:hypothetical protein
MTRTRDYLRRRADDLVRDAAAGKIEGIEAERAEGLAKGLRSARMVADVVGLARSNTELAASVDQWDRAAFSIGTPDPRRSRRK